MKKIFISLMAAVLGTAGMAQAQANQPFVASFTQSLARNNYTGYVGMQFTVGSAPVTVTALGRVNPRAQYTATHTVKLVTAATGADLPGGTVQVHITTQQSGGTDVIQYASLASPVTLQANTSYRLLSQETSQTDQWYDLTPVVTTNIATVNGGVYTDSAGNQIVVPGTAGNSYGPVSFLYGTANSGNPPPTVTILNVPGVQSTPYEFVATVSSPIAGIASVQFQLNGQNYGPLQTAITPYSPGYYTVPVLSNSLLNNSIYSLTALATDTLGDSASSAPVLLTISSTDQTLLTGQTLGAIRNNYGDPYGHFAGMEFTVGAQPLYVYELARYVASGNNQQHLVKMVNAATGVDVPGGSVTISLAGITAGQYAYGYFATPVVLPANTSYYLVSQETAGGDDWYDLAPVTPGVLGTVKGAVYQDDNGIFNLVKSSTNYSYIPLNLGAAPTPGPYTITISTAPLTNASYSGVVPETVTVTPASSSLPIVSVQLQVDGTAFGQVLAVSASLGSYSFNDSFFLDTTQLSNGLHTLSALATDIAADTATAPSQSFTVSNSSASSTSQPFITSFKGTFLRSNYNGFVGMQFSTGNSPLTIASLGRYCAPGSFFPHTVKLVSAATGQDVAGGSASVSMAYCTVGQTVYAPLTSPLVLPAGSSYYLVSQEAIGGDQWYDYSPVTAVTSGTTATVTGPVYSNGATYATVPAPSYSYGPVNFQFSTVNQNTTLSVTAAQIGNVITAAPVSSGKVLAVQFQIDGLNIYGPVTASPYTLTVPSLSYGTHQITAIASDSLGNTVTSNTIEDDVVCYSCLPSSNPTILIPVMSFAPTTLRNNYTGWVGFQFTIPPSTSNFGPIPASVLEARCVAGNTQGHLIKVVDAATGLDVPGTTMWVNPQRGCNVPFPQGLAGTTSKSYYLVIQETSGGDQWYDISPAAPMPFNEFPVYTYISAPFSVDGPVYFDGSKYVLIPLPNYSYVGLLFAGFTTTV